VHVLASAASRTVVLSPFHGTVLSRRSRTYRTVAESAPHGGDTSCVAAGRTPTESIAATTSSMAWMEWFILLK
jgi:hypothetical protein